MKNTKKLTFAKLVKISTASTKAIITIEHGTNIKGEPFRNLNQVNTSNSVVYDARDAFEDFEISLEEMVEIIEGQGFKQIEESVFFKYDNRDIVVVKGCRNRAAAFDAANDFLSKIEDEESDYVVSQHEDFLEDGSIEFRVKCYDK